MNEITYQVEVPDIRALQRHFRRVSPSSRRLRIFQILFTCGLSLDSAIRYTNGGIGHRVLYFFVMAGLYFAFFTVLNFIIFWFAQFRAHRDTKGVLGEHTITLTPEALRERTSVNDSKAFWKGIHRIDVTPEHFFIFTQPAEAHFIPRRAFPTPADADQFLATARAYHAAALSPGPPPIPVLHG